MILDIEPDARKALQDKVRERNRDLWSCVDLRTLFFEVTTSCNLRCAHCGSRCEAERSSEVPTGKLLSVLDDVIDRLDVHPFMCLIGGEPLLRRDLCGLGRGIMDRGCQWGIVTNGMLVDGTMARRLVNNGCVSVTVSVDGLREAHDRMRGSVGSWDGAMRCVDALIRERMGRVDVMTCVHKGNIGDLDGLLDVLMGIDIDSWRVDFVDPIGRALDDNPDMVLSYDERKYVLAYVKGLRDRGIPVSFSCPHFHGDHEMDCRNLPFKCHSGISVASITTTGDIVGCLDCERTPCTVFGNVYEDDFVEVWKHGFVTYRDRAKRLPAGCQTCDDVELCLGGSMHTFDFDRIEQRVCMVREGVVR